MKIKLSDIKPSPRAIRKTWSEEGLDELAQSIKEHGVIVPIKVRPSNGKYELVYGHRRVKAMRRAGVQETDVIVEGVSDTKVLVEALIENVQREDMEPLDIAGTLFAIQEETGWSQTEMAKRGILPGRTISRYMALLRESSSVQNLVTRAEQGGVSTARIPKGKVTISHIDEVRESGLEEKYRTAVIRKAAKEGLTADQTRRVADSVGVAPSDQAKRKVLEWEYSPTLHDPERLRERAKTHGAHDAMYRERAPKADSDWRDVPEVKAVIDAIREIHREFLPTWQKSGVKMSPEAKRFIARLVHNLAKDLEVWATRLEG